MFCTRNAQVLDQLARKYRVENCYRSVDELIKAKPDAVMLHTATKSHFEIVQQLLSAGIPIFVDKPLAYKLTEVEVLLDLARKQNVLLYLGFNRRFVPLVAKLKNKKASHVTWEKNRVNLPADSRVFIFDDFIHVLDSLRFLSGGEVQDIRVNAYLNNELLERVYVQWQDENTLVEAKMNRVSGVTEERIQYYTPGKKYELESLEKGWVYEQENQTPLAYDPWASTLSKRGFEDLIADWLQALKGQDQLHTRLEDIYYTHALCEQVLKQL